MQQYFVDIKKDDFFFFSKEDNHHLINVMRVRSGEIITCVYLSKFYKCEVEVSNKECQARIIEEIDDNHELKTYVRLIYGLPKGEKLDLVIQKCVELGVREIVLYNASRSIVKFDEKKIASKLERLNRISKEASNQSKRNIIPLVKGPIELDDIPVDDINLIAYEEESKNDQSSLFEILNNDLTNKVINIVVGPEGGFENKEVNYLKNKGYKEVSLGRRILRSETACIDLMAIIAFMSER